MEQTKAYSPGTLVTHDDVRTMLGVLSIDRSASKGLITTTSDLQPKVMKSREFAPFFHRGWNLAHLSILLTTNYLKTSRHAQLGSSVGTTDFLF